jgi:hypothetical protein
MQHGCNHSLVNPLHTGGLAQCIQVSFVWILDTAHQVLCAISVYHDTVQTSMTGMSGGFECECVLLAHHMLDFLSNAHEQLSYCSFALLLATSI